MNILISLLQLMVLNLKRGDGMIRMIYEYTCCLCPEDNKHTEIHNIRMDSEIPRPCLPTGWHQIDNQIICNKHGFSIYDIIRLQDEREKMRQTPEDNQGESSGAARKGGI